MSAVSPVGQGAARQRERRRLLSKAGEGRATGASGSQAGHRHIWLAGATVRVSQVLEGGLVAPGKRLAQENASRGGELAKAG